MTDGTLRGVDWDAVSLRWEPWRPQRALRFDPELEELYLATLMATPHLPGYLPFAAVTSAVFATVFAIIWGELLEPFLFIVVALGGLFIAFGLWRFRATQSLKRASVRIEIVHAMGCVIMLFTGFSIISFGEDRTGVFNSYGVEALHGVSAMVQLAVMPTRTHVALICLVIVTAMVFCGFFLTAPGAFHPWRACGAAFFTGVCPAVYVLIADYERRVQFIAAAQLARVDSRITRELEVSVQAVQERVPPRLLRHLFRGRPLWDDSDECVLVLLRVAPPASVPLHQKVRTLQAAAAAHAEHTGVHCLLSLPTIGDTLSAIHSPAFVRQRNRVAAPAIGACLVAHAVDVAARAASGRPVVSGAVHCEAALVAIASASLVPTVLGGVLPACTAVLAAATAAGGVVVTWPVRERIISETKAITAFVSSRRTHVTDVGTAFPRLIPGFDVTIAAPSFRSLTVPVSGHLSASQTESSLTTQRAMQCYWLMPFNNASLGHPGSAPPIWCGKSPKDVPEVFGQAATAVFSSKLTAGLRRSALGIHCSDPSARARSDSVEARLINSQYESEWVIDCKKANARELLSSIKRWVIGFPAGPFACRTAETNFWARTPDRLSVIASSVSIAVLHVIAWGMNANIAISRSPDVAAPLLALSAAIVGAGVGLCGLRTRFASLNAFLTLAPTVIAAIAFLVAGDVDDAVANRFFTSSIFAMLFARPLIPWKWCVLYSITYWVPVTVILFDRDAFYLFKVVSMMSMVFVTPMALLQAERQARKLFAVTDTARRTLRASKLEIDAVRAVLAATAGSAELADLDPSRPPAARCLLALDVGPHVRRTPLSTPLSLVAEVAARQQELDSIAAEFRPWCHAVRGSGPTKWFVTLRDDAECAAALAQLALRFINASNSHHHSSYAHAAPSVMSSPRPATSSIRAVGVLHYGPVVRIAGRSTAAVFDDHIVSPSGSSTPELPMTGKPCGLPATGEGFVGAGMGETESVLMHCARTAGCVYATDSFVSMCPNHTAGVAFDSAGTAAVRGVGRVKLFLPRSGPSL